MPQLKPASIGEELYLVHLQRIREAGEGIEGDQRKRRSSSVGEELWTIHMKRSRSVLVEEDDLDREEDQHSFDNKRRGHHKTSRAKKCDAPKYCRYNLRSKSTSSIKKD